MNGKGEWNFIENLGNTIFKEKSSKFSELIQLDLRAFSLKWRNIDNSDLHTHIEIFEQKKI